ncbi:MAG: hypothetical protein WD017_02995, partial [Cucumibacter sp.]
MAEALVEPAPAKINLALHVVGRCDNGFHELHGLTVFTELSDELEALPASADRLELKGPFAAGLGASNSNLIRRAVDAFRAEWPGQVKGGVAIVLNKMLPVASGIGGGSADAPAALRAVSLQSLLERKQQSQVNLQTNQSYLGATDTAIGGVSSLLANIRGTALGVSDSTSSDLQRTAAAQEVSRA